MQHLPLKNANNMKPIKPRLESLWQPKSPSPGISEYIESFGGEFYDKGFESHYPYNGKASAVFRRMVKIEEFEASERFEGKGTGCWALREDSILNDMTADLIAAAEILGGILSAHGGSSFPGGIGAESSTIWVDVLDGGVGVKVVMWEHECTNQVDARQRTTIRGPKAYRALLELLGFDWINRRLPGEAVTPSHREIINIVNDLLAKSHREAGTHV